MSDSSRLNTEDSEVEFSLADQALENERQLLAAELAQLHAEERALSVAHSLAKLAYRKARPIDNLLLDMSKSDDRRRVLLEGESRFESFVESSKGRSLPVSAKCPR